MSILKKKEYVYNNIQSWDKVQYIHFFCCEALSAFNFDKSIKVSHIMFVCEYFWNKIITTIEPIYDDFLVQRTSLL